MARFTVGSVCPTAKGTPLLGNEVVPPKINCVDVGVEKAEYQISAYVAKLAVPIDGCTLKLGTAADGELETTVGAGTVPKNEGSGRSVLGAGTYFVMS